MANQGPTINWNGKTAEPQIRDRFRPKVERKIWPNLLDPNRTLIRPVPTLCLPTSTPCSKSYLYFDQHG
jgi:hypothetical protein